MTDSKRLINGQSIANTFIAETRAAIDQELRRITHSLAQLSEEDIWWQPGPSVNSIGTIIRHLCGNLRQWFLHGIGGQPDVRDRPAEFAAAASTPKDKLLADLTGVVHQIHEALDAVDADDLLQERRVQGFDTNGLAAIYSTVAHFEGHALQIAYITHLRLGERYEPFWKPTLAEQGAD